MLETRVRISVLPSFALVYMHLVHFSCQSDQIQSLPFQDPHSVSKRYGSVPFYFFFPRIPHTDASEFFLQRPLYHLLFLNLVVLCCLLGLLSFFCCAKVDLIKQTFLLSLALTLDINLIACQLCSQTCVLTCLANSK